MITDNVYIKNSVVSSKRKLRADKNNMQADVREDRVVRSCCEVEGGYLAEVQ